MGTAGPAFTSIKVSYTSRARELERERKRYSGVGEHPEMSNSARSNLVKHVILAIIIAQNNVDE